MGEIVGKPWAAEDLHEVAHEQPVSDVLSEKNQRNISKYIGTVYTVILIKQY